MFSKTLWTGIMVQLMTNDRRPNSRFFCNQFAKAGPVILVLCEKCASGE